MNQVYPAHLYEPIRREIAVSYVRHELRKYLPTLRDDNSWKSIDNDIASWVDQAPFLFPVRDFWNGFYGIVMGFKLLIHFSDFVTAENISWQRETINPKELVFAGFNPKEFGIDMVSSNVEEAIDFYNKPGNQAKRVDDQAKLFKTFEKTAERVSDPIVVTQKKVNEQDRLVIYEGNARVYQAVLDGKNSVDAYIGRFSDERRTLSNFWVSTAYLLELSHLARAAWRDKDEATYQATVAVLKKTLSFSEAAKYEMRDRAISDPAEFKKKLLADLML